MMSVVPIEPPPPGHVTVMPAEVTRLLAPGEGELLLDVTAGGGGHSFSILQASATCKVLAFDRDPSAVATARERLAGFGARALVSRLAFGELEEWLAAHAIPEVDGVVVDLGVSSLQLDDPDRGMSFRAEGPIDMRMDPDSGESALGLIARLTQEELADVIYDLGEERRSRRVARCIKQALDDQRLHSTLDLRRAVVRAVGPRRVGGVDPATRTFQALRIAVNDELGQLDRLLRLLPRIVRAGGRVVCISFHSLEDRQVKRALADRASWERLTPKPIGPGDLERARNPRARSAKLRAARRRGLEADGSSAGGRS